MESQKLILLVEDNEDDVFILKMAFKKAGLRHPVAVAEDGQQALDYLRGAGEFADRNRFPLPALVLLDLKLPKIMGLDVLRAIRENPGLAPLIVTVLTSSDQDRDIERAYRLGANSYLVKPSAADRILQMARTLCEYWLEWNVSPPV